MIRARPGWRLCLLAWVAAVGGCNLAPRYRVPVTAVPVAYGEAQPWHAARPADRLARDGWWRLFGDPILDALEARVDGGNPTLVAALASYDKSRTLVVEAEAGLLPTLGLAGQINSDRQSNRRPRRRPGQPNAYEDDLIDVQARYEIDLWGEVANQVRSGRDLAQAAAAELETVRLQLHAELASDYIALRGLDAEADVLRRAVAVFGQGVALTENRFRGGVSPLLDVTRAQSQWEDARAQLTDVLRRRALLEHAVAVLVGVPPAALPIPEAPWRLRQPDVAPDLPSTLLQRRPDIASAERQVAAANATIGVARAAFYPTLSLNLLYGLEATSLNVFSLPDDFWAVGPGLALPLFEGGLRDAEEQAAVDSDRIAAANYRATVLAAFGEVEDRLSDLRLLAREEGERRTGAGAADRTLAMATTLYRDGATNFLDVVVAQTEDLGAERAVVQVRTASVEASLGLIRALGGGWNRTDLPDAHATDAAPNTAPAAP